MTKLLTEQELDGELQDAADQFISDGSGAIDLNSYVKKILHMIQSQKQAYLKQALDNIYNHIPSSHAVIHTDQGHDLYQELVLYIADYEKGLKK